MERPVCDVFVRFLTVVREAEMLGWGKEVVIQRLWREKSTISSETHCVVKYSKYRKMSQIEVIEPKSFYDSFYLKKPYVITFSR